MADALMALTENTDRTTKNYRHVVKRYGELIEKKPEKKDNRTGEEIAADVIKGLMKKG